MSPMLMCFLFLLSLGTSASEGNVANEELRIITVAEKDSVNITCKFSHKIDSMYLKQICSGTICNTVNVLYVRRYDQTKKENLKFANRTEYFQEDTSTAIIRLQNLTMNDTGVYTCESKLQKLCFVLQVKAEGEMVLAKRSSCSQSSSSSWMLYIIIILSLLLVSTVGLCILFHKDIKKYCKKGKKHEARMTVYEDMTSNWNRSNVTKPNPYCRVAQKE
ncbi:uncharacterized protein LOC123035674 isoform X2 [Varanus komodoensis]|uniref:uncharacterized protein LOC123035674 isoform X2 n=1 Tax=Varanus komodoensis TaxID=61221 RepID=UPI001CF7D9A1|nr:uncharacterized protein LOC123035674 isoform X2 [Varanus komodoensis]